MKKVNWTIINPPATNDTLAPGNKLKTSSQCAMFTMQSHP